MLLFLEDRRMLLLLLDELWESAVGVVVTTHESTAGRITDIPVPDQD